MSSEERSALDILDDHLVRVDRLTTLGKLMLGVLVIMATLGFNLGMQYKSAQEALIQLQIRVGKIEQDRELKLSDYERFKLEITNRLTGIESTQRSQGRTLDALADHFGVIPKS